MSHGEYVKAYRDWVSSMSPVERRKLRQLGLAEPDVPTYRANGRYVDAADLPIASHTPTDIDTECDHGEARADVIAAVCSRLASHRRPALMLDALCYATGIAAIEGLSATDLARRHGVTRQAISKLAVSLCDTFGLRPSRAMRSRKAREAYRQRARRVHNAAGRSRAETSAPTVEYVLHLDRLRRWYSRRISVHPLSTWTAEARRRLKQELQWVAELHDIL